MVVMQTPHSIMMMGRKMLGRKRLSRTLVMGSASAYETKKIESEALYWPLVMFKSFCRPSILAFPLNVRQRILELVTMLSQDVFGDEMAR